MLEKVFCCFAIAFIRRDTFQGRLLIKGFLKDRTAHFCIVNIGGVYLDMQQMTLCICHDMPLTTFHLFFPHQILLIQNHWSFSHFDYP